VINLNVAAITEGVSSFEADVSAAEVDLLESSEFKDQIHLRYDFNRIGHEIFVSTKISTTMDLSCDVCLDFYRSSLNETVNIILTKDKELAERGEEDVYLISDATTEVDITDSIRQSLLLAVPYKKTCREDCKGLCPTCGANLNKEQCTCVNEKSDPRWDALKNISFDND